MVSIAEYLTYRGVDVVSIRKAIVRKNAARKAAQTRKARSVKA